MPLKKQIKIGLSLALVVMLASSSSAHAIAGGPTLTVQLSQSSVAIGDQFTANILIDTKTYSVSAVDLHITFPADKLQAISVVKGPFLPIELSPGTAGTGTASIEVASGPNAKQGTGVIAIITFKALTAGSAQVAFATSTLVAATGQSSNVVDTMTPAAVTVTAPSGGGGGGGGGGGSSTPTPSPTATPTATATPTSSGTPIVCPSQYDPVCGVNGVTYPNRCVAEQQYRIAVAAVGVCRATTSSTPIPTRTPSPTPRLNQAGTVSTGPGDITVLALACSSLVTLLYVGYTHSNTFRRREIEDIAADERQHPPDFRS